MTHVIHSVEEVEAAGGYQIILADYCWAYDQKGRGAAENHYVTQPLEWGMSLPVKRIAAKNAALFMWGTWPNLKPCIPMMEAWGFDFRTLGFLWVKNTKNDKVHWGGGSYTRANSEFCLLGIRGRMSAISHSVHQLVESWQERDDLILRAPVGRHSAKPAEVRDRIVELFGDLPRIELFTRERIAGWDCFGNDPALGGPDVDLAGEYDHYKEENETSTTVNMQQNKNTYINERNNEQYINSETEGEDDMGQMPQAVRDRIAKSRATAGGNNIKHGEYLLMFWKSTYEKMNSGHCHINEFITWTSKKVLVQEGDNVREVEPNQPMSPCSYVINYDGKGKQSADGNSKALVLGLFGLREDEVADELVAETLGNLTDDTQPAKGMLIKLTTYPKEIRSRPGNFITGMRWECVDKPGTGENSPEKVAERLAHYDAISKSKQEQKAA